MPGRAFYLECRVQVASTGARSSDDQADDPPEPKNARGQAAISASAVRRTHLRSVAAAALLTLLPLAAHAAGFDCAKAASPTEKAICADAALSKLDGDLATAWKQALGKGGDTAALKAAQLKWLKQRDRCGDDAQCLGDRYRERLASLNGKPLAADRWQQTWYMTSDNPSFGGVLTFTGTAPHLHFELSGNNGANTGGRWRHRAARRQRYLPQGQMPARFRTEGRAHRRHATRRGF